MKPGGGKSKGSNYEREIAKKLSLWLTNGKRNDTIWRTSNSGGMATVTNSDTQCGDLHSVREESKAFFDVFSLELKNYKELDFFQLFKTGKTPFIIETWWKQALNDATRANKEPILIIKINRKPELIIFDAYKFPLIVVKYLEWKKDIPSEEAKGMTIKLTEHHVVVLPLDTFLEDTKFKVLDI